MPKARKPDTSLHVCWATTGQVYVVKAPSEDLLKRLDRMSGGKLKYGKE